MYFKCFVGGWGAIFRQKSYNGKIGCTPPKLALPPELDAALISGICDANLLYEYSPIHSFLFIRTMYFLLHHRCSLFLNPTLNNDIPWSLIPFWGINIWHFARIWRVRKSLTVRELFMLYITKMKRDAREIFLAMKSGYIL